MLAKTSLHIKAGFALIIYINSNCMYFKKLIPTRTSDLKKSYADLICSRSQLRR